MQNKIYLFAILTASALLFMACGQQPTANPQSNVIGTLTPVPPIYAGLSSPLGEDAAVPGAEVYKLNCESCHGRKGYGDGPAGSALVPAPKNLAILRTLVGEDYLYWRISEGKAGTAMIGWANVLTEEQIWQVVAYIQTFE